MKKITRISSIFSMRQRIKLSNRFLYEAIVSRKTSVESLSMQEKTMINNLLILQLQLQERNRTPLKEYTRLMLQLVYLNLLKY